MELLLDAANTIIYKPEVAYKFLEILNNYGICINFDSFSYNHKLLSELIIFPDRTSKDFYEQFNRELLYSLGIVPNYQILDDLFIACSYLPWKPFDDIYNLKKWKGEIGVLSNFHSGLEDILSSLMPDLKFKVITSENSKFRKPDVRFFQQAIEICMENPSDIIYIGDSIKLDLEPAQKVGMNAWLIDRDNFYPSCTRRIGSFENLFDIIK